jgi:hypothetical protein
VEEGCRVFSLEFQKHLASVLHLLLFLGVWVTEDSLFLSLANVCELEETMGRQDNSNKSFVDFFGQCKSVSME